MERINMTSWKQIFACANPQDSATVHNQVIKKQLKEWAKHEKPIIKILLLGIAESGKSTITKQMQIIHRNGFDDNERTEKINWIRKNLRDSILTILGAMRHLNIKFHDKKLHESRDFLLSTCTNANYELTDEFYQHTERLWKDPGVLECYERNSEYQLIDCAKYFLDHLNEIRQPSYIPNDQDILRCRILTNNIQKIEFNVQDGKSSIPFQVFDVGGQRGERKKWIQMFDNATAILYVLDSSSFDLRLREDVNDSTKQSNRLLESTEVFEHIWNSRFLKNVSVILFLNKIDLLEQKLKKGLSVETLVESIPSTHKFYNLYNRVYKQFTKPTDMERKEFIESFQVAENRSIFHRKSSRSPSIKSDILDEVIRTAVFIKRVFMEVANISRKGSEGKRFHSSHTCEYFYTCAVDTNNVRKVLEGCRSIIIRRHFDKIGISMW